MPVHFRLSDTPRAILLVAAAALVAMLPWYVADMAKTFHIDFVAFWCAGAAVLQHRNPYLDESLHACNLAHGLIPTLTLPVAHPPYVLPLFAAFALMPFSVAFVLWTLVSLACCALSAAALCRLTKVHWAFAGAVVALTVAIPSLPLGQLVPLAFCGFCWALVFVRDGRAIAATAALAVAASLPNVAETAWLGAFAAERRMRIPLIVAGLLLVFAGGFAAGFDRIPFYAGVVLPAYGRSELDAFWQLGSTAGLHALGIPQSIAVPASYAVLLGMLVLGLYLGLKLRDRFGGNHWVVAAMAALGVLGAPYSHLTDVAFAVPLALMLLDAHPTRMAAAATLLVVTPWQHLFQNTGVQAAICIPFLLLVTGTLIPSVVWSAVAVAAISSACLFVYQFVDAAALQLKAAAHVSMQALPPAALAEVRWTEFSHLARSLPDAAIMRLSLYVSVLAVLSVATRATIFAEKPR